MVTSIYKNLSYKEMIIVQTRFSKRLIVILDELYDQDMDPTHHHIDISKRLEAKLLVGIL